MCEEHHLHALNPSRAPRKKGAERACAILAVNPHSPAKQGGRTEGVAKSLRGIRWSVFKKHLVSKQILMVLQTMGLVVSPFVAALGSLWAYDGDLGIVKLLRSL